MVNLDISLISCGITLYLAYNLIHLYICRKFPSNTAFSWEIDQRKASVDSVFQVEAKDRSSFTTELSGKKSSANTHVAYSAAVFSLTGVLGTITRVSNDNEAAKGVVKCTAIAVFSLSALLCFYGSSRTLDNVNFLVTVPEGRDQAPLRYVNIVKSAVVRGIVLLEAGYRLFYLALALLPWFFGPIPMIIAVVSLVALQCIKDFHVHAREPDPEVQLT